MTKMRINLLNPTGFFCLVWLVQILGYFFYKDSFGSYENETWITIALALSSFVVGSFVAQKIFKSQPFDKLNKVSSAINSISDKHFNHFVIYFCLVCSLVVVIVTMKITDQIFIASETAIQSFSNVRDVINYDFNNHRYFYHLFRFYHIVITSVLFVFAFLPKMSRVNLVWLFAIGLMASMLTTSRLILLFYILTMISILFCHKKITMKQVFLCLCGFVLFFFGMAVIVKKGYNDQNSPLEILKWNFQVYLFSPLAAFNYYIKTGEPTFDSIVMIPNSVKEVLEHIGVHLQPRTNLMPFVNTPLRTNVYTYLYPVYHDGGKILTLFIGLLLGFCHQIIYKVSQVFTNPLTIYIFSISLYPIAVSFFEDAYFSSPGFMTFQLAPLLVFGLFIYFKTFSKRARQAT